MTPSEEQVLVIPTRVLHEAGLFQGLNRDVDHYLRKLLDPELCSFMPRAQAEEDPNWKQLIPYVILKHRDQVFQYTRGKGMGEKRLHGLRSIGIGGHINPLDRMEGKSLYLQGMAREVSEEVLIETTHTESYLGFINDDSTPVGQVHLGIVHLFELEAPDVRRRERDLTDAGFAPIQELAQAKEAFETWSQFVLTELARGASVISSGVRG
jgi:predicted NUDIX family phosphoesterase